MSDTTSSLPEGFDTTAHIESIDRRLSIEREEDAVAVESITSQVFPTNVDDLWDALTNAERLPRWFAPVTGELRLGGQYQVEGNAGGTVTSCEPPHSFSATWEFGGGVSQVEVMVQPEDHGARFTLTHRDDISAEFWDQFGAGATGVGWDLAFLGLNLHLRYQSNMPAESEKWIGTEESYEFIGEVSHRWAEAALAAGAPEDDVRAAEKRATAFYRGETGMEV